MQRNRLCFPIRQSISQLPVVTHLDTGMRDRLEGVWLGPSPTRRPLDYRPVLTLLERQTGNKTTSTFAATVLDAAKERL